MVYCRFVWYCRVRIGICYCCVWLIWRWCWGLLFLDLVFWFGFFCWCFYVWCLGIGRCWGDGCVGILCWYFDECLVGWCRRMYFLVILWWGWCLRIGFWCFWLVCCVCECWLVVMLFFCYVWIVVVWSWLIVWLILCCFWCEVKNSLWVFCVVFC